MARRGRRKASKRRSTVVSMLFLFSSVLFATWIVSDGLRDAQDMTWVRCEVVEAESQRGGRYSSVPWFVVVHTADCGPIIYQVGTNEDNVDGLAAIFEPGPYELKLGAVSQRRVKGETLLDHPAVAKDIRRHSSLGLSKK